MGLIHIFNDREASAAKFLTDVSEEIGKSIADNNSQYVNSILKHPFLKQGHMIRPYLAFLSAKALKKEVSGDDLKRLVYFAASVELLHTASLVHDDVLDSSDTRRGVECLHKVFGDKNAILAGNIFYIKAFEIIVKKLGRDQLIGIMETAKKMCYGEILQQQYEGKVKPAPVYYEIVGNKTAALIALACGEAANIAGASASETAEMKKLGELIGMIYQLQDDCKDGDAGVETGFDFKYHAGVYAKQVEEIVKGLPVKEHANALETFTLRLKECTQ